MIKETKYTYSQDNRLSTITYNNGETTEIIAPEGDIPTENIPSAGAEVQSAGTTIRNGSDASEVQNNYGRVEKVKKKGGLNTSIERNENEQISSIAVDENGNEKSKTQMTYDNSGNLIETYNPFLDASEEYAYNEKCRKTYEKDREDRETNWEYDEFGNILSEQKGTITPKTTKSYTYFEDGDLVGLKETSEEYGQKKLFQYDEHGHLFREYRGENIPGEYREEVLFTRDEVGNVIAKIDGNNRYTVLYTYNEKNEIISAQEARGTTHYTYEDCHSKKIVTDPAQREFTFFLDNEGLLQKQVWPDGREWNFLYNKDRQIISKQRPDGTAVTYEYGHNGRLQRELLPDGKYNLRKYTDNDALIWAANQEVKITSKFDLEGRHIGYDYIFRGKETIEVRFELDKSGKRTGITVERNKITPTVIDVNGNIVTLPPDFDNPDNATVEQDAQGRVSKVTNGPVAAEYIYNSTTGILEDIVETGTIEEVINREALISPVTYSYDEYGQMENITSGSFQLDVTYDEKCRMKNINRGNAVNASFDFYSSGKVKNIQEEKQGTTPETLYSAAMEYNDAGDLTSLVEPYQAWGFGYDNNDQVVFASKNNTTGNSQDDRTWNYEYDEVGNKTIENNRSLFYDGDDKLTCRFDGLWAYEHDANGYMVKRVNAFNTEDEFEYNALGQLTRFIRKSSGNVKIEATYTYGPAGRRIGKKLTYTDEPEKNYTHWYVYDQDNILLVLDESLEPVRQYISALETDTILGYIENGEAFYFSKDYRGSVTTVTNESGEVVARYEYDPFGNIIKEEGDIYCPYRFTSREYDEESDTYYYRNRQYNPVNGRFLQPDQLAGRDNDPISVFNPYTYARNNPMKYIDPYGLIFGLIIGAVLLIAKVVIAAIAVAAAIIAAVVIVPVIAAIAIGVIYATIGLVVGLFSGIVSAIKGNGFGAGFRQGWRAGIKFTKSVLDVIGVAVGVALGIAGAVLGGIIGFFKGIFSDDVNVWEGLKEGAKQGWRAGFGTGRYLVTWFSELAYNVLVQLPDYELEAYNARFSSFLLYATRLVRFTNASVPLIDSRLPAEFVVHSLDDTDIDPNLYPNTDTKMYTAYDADNSATLITFSPTDGAQDWLENIFFQYYTRADWPYDGFQIFNNAQVGTGFLRDYDSIRDRMFDRIAEVEAITGANPVWVCGHSLGGALAGLAAVDIAQRLGRDVRLYTYGSPLYGNRDFVELMYNTLQSIHTVYNSGDVVANVPFVTQGYVRPGNKVRFEENLPGTLQIGGQHAIGTYAGNILTHAVGINTEGNVDFNDPNVINYLNQMGLHAFDFFPIFQLFDNVQDFIETEDTDQINGQTSKNSPALS